MTFAYYNEFDPHAAQWLRNLIAAGIIAPGDVDERSISDVAPQDLAGYAQCHFFAGIGGWSFALRLAGWPDHRPVWTGSCPCQPFSVAGAGAGTADERHLWPDWYWLISQCGPTVVFGEQVDAAVRHGWLDLVRADLEGIGYAFAATDLPAASVEAPHIRQRLWFVADALYAGRTERGAGPRNRSVAGGGRLSGLADADGGNACAEGVQRGREHRLQPKGGGVGRLGNAHNSRLEGLRSGHKTEGGRVGEVRPTATPSEFSGLADAEQHRSRRETEPSNNVGQETDRPANQHSGCSGASCWLADADRAGSQQGREATETDGYRHPVVADGGSCRPGPLDSPWRNADWLFCRDGKWRPVEPGTFPLAHGVPGRVGRLRAYGNAIVPQVTAEVIRAYMECRP